MSRFIDQLFQLKTEEQFADWLWKSLYDLHRAPSGGKMQSELYRFMTTNGMESPVEALAAVYDRYICEYDMKSYRKAIGLALRRCTRESGIDVFQIATDLIYLLGRLSAVEALGDLLAVFSGNWLAVSGLLHDCMATMQALEPCDEVFNFTSSLVQSSSFDDGYILTAIKIMCDCRPDSSAEIVDNFGQRILNVYKRAREGCPGEEAVFWKAVLSSFPVRKVRDRILLQISKK